MKRISLDHNFYDHGTEVRSFVEAALDGRPAPLMDFLETAGPTLFAEKVEEMTDRSGRQDGDWLKPCPFCGSKAVASMYSPDMLFKVECEGCTAKVSGFDQCKQDAVDAWNARATRDAAEDAQTSPIGQADVEALMHLADSMGFGRTHDMLRRVIAATPYLSAPPQPAPDAAHISQIIRDHIKIADWLDAEWIDDCAEAIASRFPAPAPAPDAMREAIAGSVQYILANELSVDSDQEIIGAGSASFKIADCVISGNWG